MGPWGPLPEAELAVHREKQRKIDAKIAEAFEIVKLARRDVKPPPFFEKRLPDSFKTWLRARLNSPESLEKLQEAEVEHQWAVYAKTSSKRPLYPRPRPLTPSDPIFPVKQQQYDAIQDACPLFQRLPPEIRADIYRAVFGGILIVEIEASHGGYRGPPPSEQHRVFWGSKISKPTGEEFVKGNCYLTTRDTQSWKPSIVPLLQTCRRIYAEAIPILYGEMVLKTHNVYNSVEWSKYLLKPRMDTIRTAHLQLNLGYPWSAPCHIIALEALLNLPKLQKVCILGRSDSMIDCDSKRTFIDEALWEQKKDIFMKPFRRFHFVKEVDIFLPIRREILIRNGEDKVGHIQLHGLTEEEMHEAKPVYCACKYRREKMKIRH